MALAHLDLHRLSRGQDLILAPGVHPATCHVAGVVLADMLHQVLHP